MNFNLYTDSIQHSKHIFFEKNHLLIKKIGEKSVAHWACLPSKALITKAMRGTESVHIMMPHFMIDKNYLARICNITAEEKPPFVLG